MARRNERAGRPLLAYPAVLTHEQVENLGAPIVSFEDFNASRPEGRIVATSGGYDPIHPGHISSLQASAEFGDVVVAIVNGDAFLRAKKGRSFQDLQTHCLIVSAIRGVDYVVPFEIEGIAEASACCLHQRRRSGRRSIDSRVGRVQGARHRCRNRGGR